MQIDKRGSAPPDLNLGFDPVLPQPDSAHLGLRHDATPPVSGDSHGGGWPFRPQALRPPAVLVLVVPQRLKMRQYLTPEQVDIPLAQFGGHRAEMQQRQQVTNAKSLHVLHQLLAYSLGAADHDEAEVVQILGLEFAE